MREARVFLLGEKRQGKTSLLRALLDDTRNVTDLISPDNHTVGIDVQVCKSHCSGGSGGDKQWVIRR